jgi:hypothetical protein
LLAALVLAQVAFAQTSEDELRPKIIGIHYPRLAKVALIQGDGLLRADSNGVTLISGPLLLAKTAIDNAMSLGLLGASI